MVGALVLHKMHFSAERRVVFGIFDNNYDLEECVLVQVVQITDTSYRVDTSSAALPRAELAAAKSFRLKNASHEMFASLPHFLPGLLCSLCCLLVENTFQNKLCWLFQLPLRACMVPGCQWRVLATRGSSRPADGLRRRDALPGNRPPRLGLPTLLQNASL